MLKGQRLDDDTIEVYAYTQDTRHYVGVCENIEDYNEFIDRFYESMGKNWCDEICKCKDENEDEDKELWT